MVIKYSNSSLNIITNYFYILHIVSIAIMKNMRSTAGRNNLHGPECACTQIFHTLLL